MGNTGAHVPEGRLHVPEGRLHVPEGRLHVPEEPPLSADVGSPFEISGPLAAALHRLSRGFLPS
ncbi:hypothetical protein WMF38_43915 [Sorangium sp. So ce118]